MFVLMACACYFIKPLPINRKHECAAVGGNELSRGLPNDALLLSSTYRRVRLADVVAKHGRLFIFIFCRIFHLVKRFFVAGCSIVPMVAAVKRGWRGCAERQRQKSTQLKNLGAFKHYKSHLMMKNLPTNFRCCLWIKRLCCASACFVFSLKYHFAFIS